MKILAKMVLALLLIGESSAFAATCEATNGWFVVTHPQEGKIRVPGNTRVHIYDEHKNLVVAFSAESSFDGRVPPLGEQDVYQIHAVFQDSLGLLGFTWSKYYQCLRCTPGGEFAVNSLVIQSDSGNFYLECKQ